MSFRRRSFLWGCGALLTQAGKLGYASTPKHPAYVVLDQAPADGLLHELTAAGLARLIGPEGEKTVPLEELVRWGRFAIPQSAPLVLLTDGSVFVADVLGLQNDELLLDVHAGGPWRSPVEQVAGILYKPPADPLQRDTLLDGFAKPREMPADRVQLENGDEVSGTVLELTERSLQFRGPSGPLKLDLDRVVAVGFNPKLARQPKSAAFPILVGLANGARFWADSVVLAESGPAVVRRGNQTLQIDRADLFALQPRSPRVTYLSDVQPASYKNIPFLSLEWPYGLDRNDLGGKLTVQQSIYPKGIGLHSTSRMTYRLEPKHKRFASLVALDDAAGSRGSVRCRVFVDKAERYQSPILHGGEPPAAVSVDVAGGKTLSLVVDFAERGDELDHLDWLEARLVT